MKKVFWIMISVTAIFALRISPVFSDSVNVNLLVSVCNANLICEDVIGENYGSCPSDCEAPPPPPPPPPTETPASPSVTPGATSGASASSDFILNPLFLNPEKLPATIAPIPNTAPQAPTNKAPSKTKVKKKPTIKPNAVIPKQGIEGELKVTPQSNRVIFDFRTTLASSLVISWGKTGTYEAGSSADLWYHQNFSKEISELLPATRYSYKISLEDTLGRMTEYEGQFTTKNLTGSASLPAITQFSLSQGAQKDTINLHWNLNASRESIAAMKESGVSSIEDKDISVRITRSDMSQPLHPLEGKVIYEGNGEQVTDVALEAGKTYYYSIFLLNKQGDYSSPAVLKYTHKEREAVAAALQKKDPSLYKKDGKVFFDPLLQDDKAMPLDQNESDVLGTCLSSLPGSQPTASDVKNNYFIQDNKELSLASGKMLVSREGPLYISIPKSDAESAKYVQLCMIDIKTNKQNSYMLTKNSEGNYSLIYPTNFTTLKGKNGYHFALEMLKYKGEKKVFAQGEILFTSPKLSPRSISQKALISAPIASLLQQLHDLWVSWAFR